MNTFNDPPQLACYIDGRWRGGRGELLNTKSPVDGSTLWSAHEADSTDVAEALIAARSAQPGWERMPLPQRQAILERFAATIDADPSALATVISEETGKPRWEADTEAAAVVGKVALSIEAHAERTADQSVGATGSLTHRAVGVMGVLGPFNFPAHLANGQIVPALLAGNTVVYKPSELTPKVAAAHVRLLNDAGLPPGVLNLVIGGREAGQALVDGDVDAIAFTGSAETGRAIHSALAGRPNVLLALEMGGNNPLVVADIPDLDAVVNILVRSAFITAGQRCTCARRIYVPNNESGDLLVDTFVSATERLRMGGPDADPEPFLGPVINEAAAERVRAHARELMEVGARRLTEPDAEGSGAFVRPTIIDATGVDVPDHEIFGPIVTIHRYDDLDSAFAAAADTHYGLAAGLVSSNPADFDRFQRVLRAGVINLNCPTTGASGRLPFGGVGASGNYRPAGYAAADFCAYPVARMAYTDPADAVAPIRGMTGGSDGESTS
ncbi:MAG: succinylglutamate-semialdehyde dehydrogenase [Acidimicrobiia bacterium]